MLTQGRAAWLAVTLGLSLSGPAAAQTLLLSRPSLAPDGTSILVNVGGEPRPEVSAVERTALWVVVGRSPTSPAGEQFAIQLAKVTQHFDISGQVRLTFGTPVDASVTEIDVIALGAKPSRVTWKRKNPKPTPLGFFPAAARNKADVYIGGSWATGVNATPQYTLDIAAAAPIRDFAFSSLPWRFSATSTWKTASSRTLDPDAITLAARVATIFPEALGDQGPHLDILWDMARAEFSRKDQASNVVTAPTVVLAHSVNRRGPGRRVVASLGLEVALGLELGTNLENKIVPGGYGGIVRIVPGGGAYLVLPGAAGLDEIRWSSVYRVRVLAADEPLVDARGDAPITTLEKGARHEWTDELACKINPFVTITVKHEYGSIPPAFKLLDHRATVGINVMWAWKK